MKRFLRFLWSLFMKNAEMRSRVESTIARTREIDAEFELSKRQILEQERKAKQKINDVVREHEANASAIEVTCAELPQETSVDKFREEHRRVCDVTSRAEELIAKYRK